MLMLQRQGSVLEADHPVQGRAVGQQRRVCVGLQLADPLLCKVQTFLTSALALRQKSGTQDVLLHSGLALHRLSDYNVCCRCLCRRHPQDLTYTEASVYRLGLPVHLLQVPLCMLDTPPLWHQQVLI